MYVQLLLLAAFAFDIVVSSVAVDVLVVVTGCARLCCCGYWLCGCFCIARDVVVVVTGCAVASALLEMLLLWLLVAWLLLRC